MPENQRGEPTREKEPAPYYKAARFEREQQALGAYAALQHAIGRAECDLSTYRFLLNDIAHIAVLGQQPSFDLEQDLQAILACGEITNLPDNVLEVLRKRRAQLVKRGSPWVEGHYRPGIYLPQEDDE